MPLRRERLGKHPAVFRALTGLTVPLFDQMAPGLVAAFRTARRQRLDRPDRQRAIGGGDDFDLEPVDQRRLTVVWLRHSPAQEALGSLLGVSDSSARRALRRCLPVLEQAGRDTMRRPDPGRGRRTALPALRHDTPALVVPVDPFEPRVQRPKRRQRAYYSGKKTCHTVKSQVAVDEVSGRIADVADRAPGPRADLAVLEQSRLLHRLPAWVGAIGDLAYVGIERLHPDQLAAAPRRKPRGKPRPPEDRRYNRLFARRRIGGGTGSGVCAGSSR